MLITDAWLKKHQACSDAIRFIKKQSSREELQLIQAAMDIDRMDWVAWYLVRRLDYRDVLKFAVNAAKLVLPIFENRFPKDTRPRKAIEAAESGVDHINLRIAARAARAADAAALDAARSARAADYEDAAYAAYAAAYAATDAAYAATYATRAASYAAYASYAANKETQKQIIDFGISLL